MFCEGLFARATIKTVTLDEAVLVTFIEMSMSVNIVASLKFACVNMCIMPEIKTKSTS